MDRNLKLEKTLVKDEVATREGGVDRNKKMFDAIMQGNPVATREGGVDRNVCIPRWGARGRSVATREGGVDRNAMSRCQTQ